MTLYFAFKARGEKARPYFFSGRVVKRERAPLLGFPGRKKIKIRFVELR